MEENENVFQVFYAQNNFHKSYEQISLTDLLLQKPQILPPSWSQSIHIFV